MKNHKILSPKFIYFKGFMLFSTAGSIGLNNQRFLKENSYAILINVDLFSETIKLWD